MCVQHPSNAPLQTSPHPPGTAPRCHPPSVTFPRGAAQPHGPVLPSGAPAGLHLTRNLKPRETGGGRRQRAKTRTQRATSTYLVRAETRLQDGDGAASPPGYPTRVPTGEVPAAPTFLPVFPCGQLEMGFITPAHSTQRSAGQCRRARHCSHPAGASPPTFRRVVCNGRGKVRKNLNAPKSSVTPGLGRALGGRRQDCFQRGFWRAWRRTGVLSVSKGKETALSLPGGCRMSPSIHSSFCLRAGTSAARESQAHSYRPSGNGRLAFGGP